MSGPGLFADLDKNVTDLLTENFPTKPKIEFNTPTNANGVSLQVTGTKNPDNSVYGTLVPKWTYGAWGLVAKGTVDTNQTFKADLAVTDKVARGLKTQVVGSVGTAQSVKFGLEYKHESLAATSSFLYTPSKASLIGASVTFGLHKWIAGAAVDYSLGDSPELKNAKGGLYFKDKDFSVAGLFKTNGDDLAVGANYYQNIGAFNAVGSELFYDVRKSNLNLAVGYKHKLDNDVTLKVRVDSLGKAAVSAQTKVNRNIDLTIGAEVDLQGINTGKDNKFGFTLSFTP